MKKENRGFTLVELLVAMAISSIMMAVILVTYQSQAQTHVTQQEVVDMHQNARAAMDLMAREIRMAGLDPTGNAGAGIYPSGATNSYLHFSRDYDSSQLDGIDNDSDGDIDETDEWSDGTIGAVDEQIEYQLRFSPTLGKIALERNGPDLPVASNIEALDFVYLDANGNVLNVPSNSVPNAVPDNNLPNIRSIQVTLIARADNPVMMRKLTDRTVYTNQQGAVLLDKFANPDTIRRLQLSTTIQCRNLGL